MLEIGGKQEEMVSIIIPTYCREYNIILRALDSIKEQTYTDWEVYVVDDNKENNLYSNSIKEAIEKEKNEKIHYLRMEKNSGACAARNKGIEVSKGEYVAFLDDDDEWFPTKLEKQIKVLENSNAGFVYCGLQVLDEKKGSVKSSNTLFLEGDVYTRLLRDNFIGGTSEIVVRRECFEKCGGFRLDMPSSQDYEMWLRLAREFPVGNVPEDLVLYHIHEGEAITKSLDKRIEGYRKILKSYHDDIVKNKENYSFQLYNLGKFLILNKQHKEGMKYLKKAIKIRPDKGIYYIAVIVYWKLIRFVNKM